MTIVKTTEGSVFGGYTKLPWRSSDKKYYGDEDNFCYSVNEQIVILQDDNFEERGIGCDPDYGPGIAYALYDGCCSYNFNYGTVGNSFGSKDPFIRANKYLLTQGRQYFQVEMYEVFQEHSI